MLSLDEYTRIADRVCMKVLKKYDDELISFLIERMVKADVKFAEESEDLKKSMRGKACGFAIKKYFKMMKKFSKEFTGESHAETLNRKSYNHVFSIDLQDSINAAKLSDDELSIIDDIYFNNETVSEVARKRNKAGMTIRYRLNKILNKVKKYV